MYSVPEGAPEWDKYCVDDYRDFGRKWCNWSRAIFNFQQSQSTSDENGAASSNDSTPAINHAESSKSAKPSTQRQKAKSNRDIDSDEEELSSSESSSREEQTEKSEEEKSEDEEDDNDNDNEKAQRSRILAGLCKPSAPTSAYERRRLDTIARNRETLLGLMAGIPLDEMPFMRNPPPNPKMNGRAKRKGKDKRKDSPKERLVPTRASVRLIKVCTTIVYF
jgi:hypothetical protein